MVSTVAVMVVHIIEKSIVPIVLTLSLSIFVQLPSAHRAIAYFGTYTEYALYDMNECSFIAKVCFDSPSISPRIVD